MTTDQAHREQVESIGAYALGALPELEAQVFERHLMACEQCQEELHRLNEAVEALPRSVTPLEPPPSLKASLMDAVNADAAPVRERRRPALGRLVPGLRPAIAWAAAACVLAAVAGYGVSELARDDGGARTLSAQVDRERLGSGSASLSVPEDEESGAVLRVEGLPEAGRGRVYQVWVERDGVVEPASIFDVDAEGAGAAAVPGSLDDVSAVMVTRERRGGAAQPTETPVLTVDV
jgi:anti-sigma-K factor RskA